MTISPDIPRDVLESAAADPASLAWRLIWEQSCHQGTCYPASTLLLPWLAQTCASFSPHDRDEAVVLAGFIAVDATDTDRIAYAEEIAALRALATESMSDATTDSGYVYLQQAVLGFEGDEVWGKELDRINADELDVQCPGCDDERLVDLTSDESLIKPGLSSALAVRLHADAVHANQNAVANTLTLLFGQFACPNCGTPFVLGDHLAGVSYE